MADHIKITTVWSIDNVLSQYPILTRDQAREVLIMMKCSIESFIDCGNNVMANNVAYILENTYSVDQTEEMESANNKV